MLGKGLGKKSGILIITNNLVMFYQPKVFGGFDYWIFPCDQISNVNCYRSFIVDKLKFNVRRERISLDSVRKGDGPIAAQLIRDMIAYTAKMRVQALTSMAMSKIDIVDQIEKLGRLHERFVYG